MSEILSEEQHDAEMGSIANGGDWTPLVDHDRALRAALEAAERERDENRTYAITLQSRVAASQREADFENDRNDAYVEGMTRAIAEKSRAEAECDRLRAALAKYGRHRRTRGEMGLLCDAEPRGWAGVGIGPCTCGFDAALAPPKEANTDRRTGDVQSTLSQSSPEGAESNVVTTPPVPTPPMYAPDADGAWWPAGQTYRSVPTPPKEANDG